MPGRGKRRVYVKKHGLPELFGKGMDQGQGRAPTHVENHQVHQLYRGSGGVNVGPTKKAGSTPHFTVYYEVGLGAAGAATAQDVLVKCEPDYEILSRWFKLSIPSFNIIIARVSEETLDLAYHDDCYSTDLYCDARDSDDAPDYTSALIASEEVEVFEAYQHKGWDCGSANGEGLSRVLAEALHPGALDAHSCAPAWLDGGRLDLVNYNYPTDTNQLANGCAVLFLNWLHHHLGYEWDKIIAAAGPNLAKTYQSLTNSKDDPFPRFSTFMARLFPANRQWPMVPDDPFSDVYDNAEYVHGGATAGPERGPAAGEGRRPGHEPSPQGDGRPEPGGGGGERPGHGPSGRGGGRPEPGGEHPGNGHGQVPRGSPRSR